MEFFAAVCVNGAPDHSALCVKLLEFSLTDALLPYLLKAIGRHPPNSFLSEMDCSAAKFRDITCDGSQACGGEVTS